MKAVVAAFNQEKALVGAFSVMVQPVVEPMDRFAALAETDEEENGGKSWLRTRGHRQHFKVRWLMVEADTGNLVLWLAAPLFPVQCLVR